MFPQNDSKKERKISELLSKGTLPEMRMALSFILKSWGNVPPVPLPPVPTCLGKFMVPVFLYNTLNQKVHERLLNCE